MEITDDLIKELMKTAGRETRAWKRAFDFYNENHEKKLITKCRPCYYKVLKFIIENKDETIKELHLRRVFL